jgi:hypothetical protein
MDTIVKACVECGVGYVELTSPMGEPANTLPGGGRSSDMPENRKMRADLRQWRLTAPLTASRKSARVRRRRDRRLWLCDDFRRRFPDEEIDVVFRQAQALGVNIIGTNQTTVGMAPAGALR